MSQLTRLPSVAWWRSAIVAFCPVPNVQLQSVQFAMEKRNQLLRVANQVTQPNTPSGGG